jgi:hypothetical protein
VARANFIAIKTCLSFPAPFPFPYRSIRFLLLVRPKEQLEAINEGG